MTNYRIKKIIESVIVNEVKIAFWVSWLGFVIIVGFTLLFYKYKGDFFRGIFVEAHGMLFDLFVIATFILWLNKKGEKRRNIERYQEEIDDYRNWKSEEATHRIVGNIRRLNRLGIARILLEDCYLENAHLKEAKLNNARINNTNLRNANLFYADLRDAAFVDADLEGANLSGAKLNGAIFIGAILNNVKDLTINQLAEVDTLYEAELETKLMEEIKVKYPHLLEEPQVFKELYDVEWGIESQKP